MVRPQFDIGLTLKTLNISLLRFNDQFGSENLAYIYLSIVFLHQIKFYLLPQKKKSFLEFIIDVLFLMPIYLNVYEDFGETWGGWLFVLKVIFIFLSLLNGGLDNDWIWGLKMGIVWFGLVFLYCTLQFEIWVHKIMWKRLIFLLALAYCFINDIITTYGVIVSCIK